MTTYDEISEAVERIRSKAWKAGYQAGFTAKFELAVKRGRKPTQVVTSCQTCGVEVRTRLSHVRRGEGKFCSRACAHAHLRSLAYAAEVE